MPALNVAPSPSPVAAPVEPAASAKTPAADGAAAGSAEGQSTTPFAAVLHQQMAQPADGKAAKAVAVLNAAVNAAADPAAAKDAVDPAAAPAEDALAYLAPMLPGIGSVSWSSNSTKRAPAAIS